MKHEKPEAVHIVAELWSLALSDSEESTLAVAAQAAEEIERPRARITRIEKMGKAAKEVRDGGALCRRLKGDCMNASAAFEILDETLDAGVATP